MTSEPKQNRPASSGARGKNLYQRMEDARARRAEVLALKQPANDDASVTKPIPLPTTRSNEPAQEPKSAALPELETQLKPNPVSRSSSKPRFPAILMPSEPAEEEIKVQKRSARPRLMMLALLLLAVIASVFYFAPRATGPLATQTIVAPSVTDDPVETTLPNTDAVPSKVGALMPASGRDIALLPTRGTEPQRPQATETIVSVFANNAPNAAPNAPVIGALWQATAAPLMPIAPIDDPLFALPETIELTISLIIPAQAARDKVRDVSEALLATGFKINEPRLVSYKVSTTQVRYFHERDAKAAAKLADDIGGTARDFTDYAPSPPIGLVEVFIEETSTATREQPVPRGLAGDLRQFGNDIRNTLRSITR